MNDREHEDQARAALGLGQDRAGRPRHGRCTSSGVELVSSGGTAAAIADAGIPVTTRRGRHRRRPRCSTTGSKTLHPKIHGGLLADRGKESHRADLETHGIRPFDLVVSNLYPFLDRPDIETIDIGGPAMTRAAAKNHAWVTIVTSPDQYGPLLDGAARERRRRSSDETRRAFALEAFARTAAYDAAIVQWLQDGELLPAHLVLALERTDETLRYGENPHQHGGALSPARHDELVGRREAARRARALVPQLLRRRRRVEARARSRRRARVRDHQARQPVRRVRSTTTSPSRTSARSSATSAPRSAASSR